ncbi:hypothetical protein [Nostoc sp.]|uniref:hypothetical protein n=1 Tax=Nostoc sp. TaxID=1180 RepID=UPI002FF4BFFF
MTNQTFTNGYALLIGVGADLPVTVLDATAIGDILIDSELPVVTLLTKTSATPVNIFALFDQIITQVNQILKHHANPMLRCNHQLIKLL